MNNFSPSLALNSCSRDAEAIGDTGVVRVSALKGRVSGCPVACEVSGQAWE
jgi:hypothetical protein